MVADLDRSFLCRDTALQQMTGKSDALVGDILKNGSAYGLAENAVEMYLADIEVLAECIECDVFSQVLVDIVCYICHCFGKRDTVLGMVQGVAHQNEL